MTLHDITTVTGTIATIAAWVLAAAILLGFVIRAYVAR